MGGHENTPAVKAKRAVTVLKLTGRNQEGGEAAVEYRLRTTRIGHLAGVPPWEMAFADKDYACLQPLHYDGTDQGGWWWCAAPRPTPSPLAVVNALRSPTRSIRHFSTVQKLRTESGNYLALTQLRRPFAPPRVSLFGGCRTEKRGSRFSQCDAVGTKLKGLY